MTKPSSVGLMQTMTSVNSVRSVRWVPPHGMAISTPFRRVDQSRRSASGPFAGDIRIGAGVTNSPRSTPFISAARAGKSARKESPAEHSVIRGGLFYPRSWPKRIFKRAGKEIAEHRLRATRKYQSVADLGSRQ